MPLYRMMDDGTAKMGIWRLTESLAELEALYRVKDFELNVYRGFRNDRRRKEWRAVRILLSMIVGDESEICYRDSGKPYLKDLRYCISITHTLGFVGIRVAQHPVAIDMEYYSSRVLHLIDRFVSKEERQYIDKRDEIASALIIWSAKETLFKLFDFQDVSFDEHLYVCGLSLGTKGVFKGGVRKDGFRAEVKLTYYVIDDLILVYC